MEDVKWNELLYVILMQIGIASSASKWINYFSNIWDLKA